MSIAVPSIGPRLLFIGDPTTAAGADMLDVGLVRRVRITRTPRIKVGTTESGAENHEAKFYQGTGLTLEVEVARSVSTGLRTYLETINSSDKYSSLGTGMDGLTVALVHPTDAVGGAAQASAKTIWIPSVRLTNAGTQEYNADGDGPDDSNFVTLTFEAGYRADDQDATAVPLGALPDFRGDELSGHSLAWSLPPPAGPAGGGGDVTDPTISSFAVANPSGQNVQVSFDSSETLVDIEVAITGAETTTLTEADFAESSGTYTATYAGSTDGTYTATLNTAEDAAGNDGAGSETDNVAIDTTAPSVPTSLTATAGDGQVDLAWTNPAQADLASIKIYRGTVSGSLSLLATHTATGEEGNADSYTDSTAANGTEYFYAIASVDDDGNESAQTGEASATPALAAALDNYATDLAMAYSLRRLLTSYEGSAIRVRRSSDSAEQDIGFDADGVLDTAALLAFVEANDGFVVTWYDQSGNGYDWTDVISPQYARIVSAGVVEVATNGLPAAHQTAWNTGFMSSFTAGTLSATSSVFQVQQTPIGSSALVGRETSPSEYFGLCIDGASQESYTTGGDPSYWGNGTPLQRSRDDLHDALATGAPVVSTTIGVDLSTWDNFLTIYATSSTISGPKYLQETVIYAADKTTDKAAIEAILADYHSVTLNTDVPTVLSIPTYDSDPNAGHPDVYDAGAGNTWNGWRYWMAFTPFPTDPRENPSIVVSNDGVTWQEPAGITNPIVTNAEAVAEGFTINSDTDIVLLPNGSLRVYWRMAGGSGEAIYAIDSADGVAWGTKTEIHNATSSGGYLSPAVVVEADDTFSMWTVEGTDPGKLYRRTSSDGLNWGTFATDRTLCTTPTYANGVEGRLWHIDVVLHADGRYYGLVATRDPYRLWIMESADGLTWTGDTTSPIITPGDSGHVDETGHYRGSIVPVGANPAFDIWYSGINAAGSVFFGDWRIIYDRIDPLAP